MHKSVHKSSVPDYTHDSLLSLTIEMFLVLMSDMYQEHLKKHKLSLCVCTHLVNKLILMLILNTIHSISLISLIWTLYRQKFAKQI